MGIETMIIGGALLGSAVEQREERRAGERDQKRARAAEKRIQDIRAARERRAAVREARAARAAAEQGGVASGASGSGQVLGVGTVGTQLASNLSFMDQVKTLSDQSSLFQEAAAKHYSRSQDWSDFGQLVGMGMSMYGAAGGFDAPDTGSTHVGGQGPKTRYSAKRTSSYGN